jgi:hypothetical protein
METPKKPAKKSTATSKSTGVKKSADKSVHPSPKSRLDDEDDDLDMDIDDDFSKFESFENYDEEEDY